MKFIVEEVAVSRALECFVFASTSSLCFGWKFRLFREAISCICWTVERSGIGVNRNRSPAVDRCSSFRGIDWRAARASRVPKRRKSRFTFHYRSISEICERPRHSERATLYKLEEAILNLLRSTCRLRCMRVNATFIAVEMNCTSSMQ